MSSPSPIACDMTALDEDARQEHRAVSTAVFGQIDSAQELSDGYAFRLPTRTETIRKAGAFVARERLCCPFFRFSLDVGSEHGPVWLEVTGREGVKAFVEDTVLPYWNLDAAASRTSPQ